LSGLIKQTAAMPSQIRWVEGYARAFALVVLDEINLLRRQHSLTPRTISRTQTSNFGTESATKAICNAVNMIANSTGMIPFRLRRGRKCLP
jgi:hypothetical protein